METGSSERAVEARASDRGHTLSAWREDRHGNRWTDCWKCGRVFRPGGHEVDVAECPIGRPSGARS